MRRKFNKWSRTGTPWIWLNAGAVAISIIMVLGLLGVLTVNGLRHFWPNEVSQGSYLAPGFEPTELIGEVIRTEWVAAEVLIASGLSLDPGQELYRRDLWKLGNRDLNGIDFAWVLSDFVVEVSTPERVAAFERKQGGVFYGAISSLILGEDIDPSIAPFDDQSLWTQFQLRLNEVRNLDKQIRSIQSEQLARATSDLERLRLRERAAMLDGELSPTLTQQFSAQRLEIQVELASLQHQLNQLYAQIEGDSVLVRASNDVEVLIPLAEIVRAYQPNNLSLTGKLSVYSQRLWEFLTTQPREGNTEGGVSPAIFGTVVMVLLMSLFVTPFGVIAAVYLREYAKQGMTTRIIRVAVNNLAGVPSIVYGVFGLGFFVYLIGGEIDQLFYAEALPAPTFGTPGLLWAALTLALLTVPVVIVATEEGLMRIPRSVREGSLALGATKFETIWRIVLPMVSPAMMTGLILAIARAAGEVAPLMLVGVVKLAPSLPVNGIYPYVHLDQQFMHLGFHIYDVGFQSPNIEAARPLVFATALLLVSVIAILNLTAAVLRDRLRETYRSLDV
ncbi:MAG: phosphate ABC transporter, permease protein PstA [Gammaproteobacteria bacterium]|nr:phosphate ABC transporter, permease protein PstA [Gammaproteobacteria bacterium]